MDAFKTHTRSLCCKLSQPQRSEETDLVSETTGQATIPPLEQGCTAGHCSPQEEFDCLGNDCCQLAVAPPQGKAASPVEVSRRKSQGAGSANVELCQSQYKTQKKGRCFPLSGG